jgi:aspartate kinase
LNPKDPGTTVGKGMGIEPKVPCFIVKKNQVLMKLSSLDFSFMVENNISEIFKLFHDFKIKVDLIQNSAISFSVCVDNKFGGLHDLLQQLKGKFKVVHNEDVSLYTIRHFNSQALESLVNGHEVLLEQRGKETVQLVVK